MAIKITVEGRVGVGKSVVVQALEDFLKSRGFMVTSDRNLQLDHSETLEFDIREVGRKQCVDIREVVNAAIPK